MRTPTPHDLRLVHLIGATILVVLLVASAGWLAFHASGFLRESVGTLSEFGLISGGTILLADLRDLFLLAVPSGTDQTVAAASAVVGLVMIGTVLTLFFLVWLRAAATALRWTVSGLLWLHPEDEPAELPHAFADPDAIARRIRSDQVPRHDLDPSERLVLGRTAIYAPAPLLQLARRLAHPTRTILVGLFRPLFYGLLAAAVGLVVLVQLDQAFTLALPDLQILLRLAASEALRPLLVWAAVFLAISIAVALLDLRFARAIMPRQSPAAEMRLGVVRDLTWNGTTTQLDQILESQFATLGRARIFRFYRLVNRNESRANFADRSDFTIEMLIEGASERSPDPARAAALWRAFTALACRLAAIAVVLFLLAPPPVLDLLAGQPLAPAAFTGAGVHLAMVLSLARHLALVGRRLQAEALLVLPRTHYATPLAALRLDGTVNTQRVRVGRALHNTTEAEKQVQELSFNAAILSTTMNGLAEHAEAARLPWSHRPDMRSDALADSLADLFTLEGDVSILKAAARTLRDMGAVNEIARQQALSAPGGRDRLPRPPGLLPRDEAKPTGA
ncbi:MAG: hypothetical protein ACK46Q_05395 [Hyphomonas sp.]